MNIKVKHIIQIRAAPSWKTTVQTDDGSKPGMQALAEAGRLFSPEKILLQRYFDDFEFKELSNWWDGFGGASNPVCGSDK